MKHICPKGLKAEHDHYLHKVNAAKEKRRNREKMQKAKLHEADFYKERSCFFGMSSAITILKFSY